jgi:hypothetical protein
MRTDTRGAEKDWNYKDITNELPDDYSNELYGNEYLEDIMDDIVREEYCGRGSFKYDLVCKEEDYSKVIRALRNKTEEKYRSVGKLLNTYDRELNLLLNKRVMKGLK